MGISRVVPQVGQPVPRTARPAARPADWRLSALEAAWATLAAWAEGVGLVEDFGVAGVVLAAVGSAGWRRLCQTRATRPIKMDWRIVTTKMKSQSQKF